MGEDRIGLQLIAQGLARKLGDIFARFEKEPSSARHISDVVIACHEARARLTVMVDNELITDTRGVAEYEAALDLIIAQGMSILDRTAEPDVGRAFMHSILAVTQWGVPTVPGQGEQLN